jgi:hypothetical protein
MSYEEAFESLIEELPDRFEEFSKIHVNDSKEVIILTPETPKIDNSGTVTARIMNGRIYSLIEEHGFVQYMTNRTKNGAGIDFWYKYDPS